MEVPLPEKSALNIGEDAKYPLTRSQQGPQALPVKNQIMDVLSGLCCNYSRLPR